MSDNPNVAVLRVMRDFYAGTVLNHPEKVAALDAAIAALEAQASAPGGEVTAEAAFEAGWITAARWAKRDDLLTDIGSAAYECDRAAALAAASRARPEAQGESCPHCGAPCRKEVLMRGGDNGWGDDASRTVYRYVPPADRAQEDE